MATSPNAPYPAIPYGLAYFKGIRQEGSLSASGINGRLNELLGFTEEEVASVLHMYSDIGALHQEADAALNTMREWYNGYRFAEGASNDLYNSDMVLYCLADGRLAKLYPSVQFTGLALVFCGWELMHSEAMSAGDQPPAGNSRDA